MTLKLETRVIKGDHKNQNKVAVLYGPLVLAADEALTDGKPIAAVVLSSPDSTSLALTPEPAPEKQRSWPGAGLPHPDYRCRHRCRAPDPSGAVRRRRRRW